MHLDQWLNQVYDEDILTKEASGLEAFYDKMDPSDLLDIACGRTTVEKVAAKMSLQRREALPSKSFAVPVSKAKKIGVAGEIKGEAKGKYPIPDPKHAKNALARVSQHGTPAEREAVRRKVYAKYPGLKAGFEERHGGASPTAKANIKKVEQGGIGKTAAAKLAFVDRIAREIARQHAEVARMQEKNASLPMPLPKDRGMEKEDEFTTPEAKAKAKVMQKSMQMAKGAPTPVRKGMVQMAAKEMKKAGSIKTAVGNTAAGQEALLKVLQRARGKKDMDTARRAISRMTPATKETAAAGVRKSLGATRRALGTLKKFL